jgi:hypothetical protein
MQEDTQMKIEVYRRGGVMDMIMFMLLLLGAGASLADENAATRSHSIAQGQGIARGAVGSGTVSYKEFEKLLQKGERRETSRSMSKSLVPGQLAKAANEEFWFFDADLILFSDLDQDGFYFGLDLAFDVDTVFVEAEVYAVIYLSFEGGPWNEYAETENFIINGASSDDQYVVVSELVSGYPTGSYDVLIEIYDTFDGSFVAEFGPDESSQLSFLPLEDIGRDAPPDTVIVVSSGSGGGGATGWPALLLLLVAAVVSQNARRRSRRVY